jgi:uncharacterized protein YneF (UPF0154 family)
MEGIWGTVGALVIGLVIGLVGGFFASRWWIKQELKKNPPINDKMIRAMFISMGRKPSEAQIQQVIRSMKDVQ